MSAAEKKFWEMPELVDRLHLDLDIRSTLCLAQVHDLTQKILQGSHAWNKLIRRSCLFNQSTTSKEKMDVVKDLAAILKLMKDSKANMVDLLDTIGKSSPPDVVSSQRHLGTVLIVGPTPQTIEKFSFPTSCSLRRLRVPLERQSKRRR